MERAKEWLDLNRDADSFDLPVAYTYEHVEKYLSSLTGNENKRTVAGNVAKIVKKAGSYYLTNYSPSYAANLKSSFQILVDKLLA
jgi:hypothetical protein